MTGVQTCALPISVAEYQRYGTDWPTVYKNSVNFCQVEELYPSVNIALSAYTILDLKNLCKFMLELYNINNRLFVNSRVVQWPTLMYIDVLNDDLKERAFDELNSALELLPDIPNFEGFRNECKVS